MKRFLLLLSGLILHTIILAQAEPFKVTDMLKIKTAGGVTLSRDGSKAAFLLTSIEPDGTAKWEYKYITQLWMVPTDGSSAPRQLTSRESVSQPAWSPDGKQLAFVRATDGKPQIFLLSLDGGEPTQLTKFRYGAAAPRWSPDGKQILFSANIPLKDLLKDSILNPGREIPKWPFEKPGIDNERLLKSSHVKANPDGNTDEVRAYLEANENDRKAKVVTKLNFQSETDVSTDLGFSHLFLTSLDADAKPIAITKGFYRFNTADFTPDGRQVVLAGSMDSTQHPDRALESSLFIVNTDGTGFTTLLSAKGKSFTSPQLSHNGQWLAFQQGPAQEITIPALGVMAMSKPGLVTEIPFDRNKSNLTWSADDRYIYFTSPSNGGTPVYKAEMKTKKVEQLTPYESGIGSFDVVGNRMIFTKTEITNPSELYLADANAAQQKRISEFNTGWLRNKQLSTAEKKSFKNDRGQTVEYWVMKPINFEPGKKYPLLLEIHGGPSAMWGPGESSMWHEYQYFCSKGYGVVYCNPRGSGGYGVDFLRANMKDWGAGPASDVLKALDKAVAEGWADTSKLMVTGGSYAGYLVAWILGHDQRFKAACAQRGVYDLATFFGEGNAWRLVPYYFGGYPSQQEVKELLTRESPISYVQHIRTPLIIFHGENDRRTGVIQSEMLYRNLKALGRPVEYVRHPGATHEITRSGNNRQRIDQLLRTWEFFERWIH